MLADVRYAVRQLRKSPGFAITAILTLALGIGANAAIFTLVDSILLKPLPFPAQDRLMQIGYGNGQTDSSFFPKGWIRAMGEQSTQFAAISGFGPNTESNVGEAGFSRRLFGAEAMTNAFAALQIHPALGQFFSPQDGAASHDPVVVLSDGFWRTDFGGDPGVIGRTLRIDGVSRRIIGVMPQGVRFPYADTQFVVPVTFKGGDPIDPWTDFDLRAFGRLKDGATPQTAQTDVRRMQKILLPLFPWKMPDIWASDMSVVPLLESQVGLMRPRLLLLFAAVGLILLIACANVANLVLARAAGREREMAIRAAVGATTHRLIRQLLCESLVLALAAGAVGLAAAALSLRGLVRLLPANTPRIGEVSLHWQEYVFAAGVAIVAGMLLGMIPALRAASPELRDALHAGSRSVAGKVGQFRTSMLLVMAQIALSVVVVSGAGLMVHSLWRLSQVDPGFRSSRVVTAEVALDANACSIPGHCRAFYQTLLERLKQTQSMEDAALADSLPLMAQQGNFVYDAEGHPREAHQGALVATGRIVTADYFTTLGLTLIRGRLLQPEDRTGQQRTVVINQHMAERLWPGQDPIGKHLLPVGDEPSPAVWKESAAAQVVGVVNNTREGGLAGAFGDEVYLPLTPQREQPVMYVLLRSRLNASTTADELRTRVAELDAHAPVTRVRALNEVVASTQASSRSVTVLLFAFGILALAIGTIGIYSLISYVVSWRTREFGIRLALGAQPWQIIRGVVRQSLVVALGGAAFGMVAAVIFAKVVRGLLFEVSAVDPVTFSAVPILMFTIAMVAAWIPARRAARIDPVRTLRLE